MTIPTTDSAVLRPYVIITQQSLLWLLVTGITGILLALILLVPSLGTILQPYSYGRWVTVHLNSSLYGWSSVPLLGLLFVQFLPVGRRMKLSESAVAVWSGVLLFAMIGWLSGHTSGKLFMEWSGPSRWAILFGMCYLSLILWIAFIQRIREGIGEKFDSTTGRIVVAVKTLSLLFLTTIPFVMYLAADPALYPPVNPDSGGATGGSLLGSTLAIVMIFWLTPFILRLKCSASFKRFVPSLLLLLVHMGAFGLLDHGDQSHHERTEIIALSSLIIWVPLLIAHMRCFEWPPGSRPWLIAFACWGATLTFNGIFTFMPHILESWKFTNALVAHVHIAMAGMVTSFNIMVLVVINQQTCLKNLFAPSIPFWAWQSGTVLHAVTLLAAGTLESMHPDWLFTGHPVMNTLYFIRLLAGFMMLTAVLSWFPRAHTMKEVYT